MWHRVISINKPAGFVLVAVAAITAGLLLLAGFFLEQSTSEIKISKSENVATETYYLAEAGANEAIYKLKNDPDWRSKFIAGVLSNETLVRNSVFDADGSYTVVANSIGSALADITVTAQHNLGGQQTQRIIQIRLARATNSADSWEQAVFGGGTGGQQNGNITFERNCAITGGKVHANQDFKVTSKAILTINDGEATSSNNIIINNKSELVLNNSTQTEGADSIGMPAIDFDSASPTSLKNRADQVYSSADFENLPGGTTLNGITFVTGDAEWTNKDLTINGILSASGDVEITLGASDALVINSTATGSGIMAKDDLEVDLNGGSLTMAGLLYSANQFILDTSGNPVFDVTGGIITWHLLIQGVDTGTCSVLYDSLLVYQPLDPVLNGTESPIIEVNHWEEQY